MSRFTALVLVALCYVAHINALPTHRFERQRRSAPKRFVPRDSPEAGSLLQRFVRSLHPVNPKLAAGEDQVLLVKVQPATSGSTDNAFFKPIDHTKRDLNVEAERRALNKVRRQQEGLPLSSSTMVHVGSQVVDINEFPTIELIPSPVVHSSGSIVRTEVQYVVATESAASSASASASWSRISSRPSSRPSVSHSTTSHSSKRSSSASRLPTVKVKLISASVFDFESSSSVWSSQEVSSSSVSPSTKSSSVHSSSAAKPTASSRVESSSKSSLTEKVFRADPTAVQATSRSTSSRSSRQIDVIPESASRSTRSSRPVVSFAKSVEDVASSSATASVESPDAKSTDVISSLEAESIASSEAESRRSSVVSFIPSASRLASASIMSESLSGQVSATAMVGLQSTSE